MNLFKHRQFKEDIIIWAVRWYCKYGISYRELSEMLEERGLKVNYSTIYRWVQRYAPEIEKGWSGIAALDQAQAGKLTKHTTKLKESGSIYTERLINAPRMNTKGV